jgi:H+-translocating NAD(P) transhydrogenase subunit beta
MSPNIAALLYLASGVLFVLALRGLSSPESSRQGNQFGMTGMAIAVLTTLGQMGATDSILTWSLLFLDSASAAVLAPTSPATFQ